MRSIFIFLAFFFFSSAYAESPSVLYLSWTHDPSSTMTLYWHTAEEVEGSWVEYREEGKEAWERIEGSCRWLTGTRTLLHRVELVGLQPGTGYAFRIVPKETVYRFRTLPEVLDRPVRFAVGGDAYFYQTVFHRMNAQIAAHNPDFVVVGGDIAYAEGTGSLFRGEGWRIERWRTFFKEWKEQMVTTDGYLIPLVPVVGNHDVRQGDPETEYFYEAFVFPRRGRCFRALDCGKYLSLVLLDTGHTAPIEGVQTKWLERALAEREAVPFKMAVYHIGAFPSVYSYHGRRATQIRQFWSPLFERYHLQMAFEHHNHAYKRTFPIKGERIDPDGVVYMGDGAWGVEPRTPHEDLWYLARVQSSNCFSLITLESTSATVDVYNIHGERIDQAAVTPRALSSLEAGSRPLIR